MPFGEIGERFSQIIRAYQNWENSAAWEILGKFRGRLLVVQPEKDEIIPAEIPKRILKGATNASQKELSVVPDSPHTFNDYLAKHPEVQEKFQLKVLQFLLEQ